MKRENDVLLITGDGLTLPEDLVYFLGMALPHDVMSIGRSINYYPGKVLHWANVDGADSKWWAEHLPPKNNGGPPIRHTLGECDGYDVFWDDEQQDGLPWHGSSSLFATLVGLELGYKEIYLAGCPLDTKGHWYWGPEQPNMDWEWATYQAWGDFAKSEKARIVHSLSGFTKKVLEDGHKN